MFVLVWVFKGSWVIYIETKGVVFEETVAHFFKLVIKVAIFYEI